MRDESGIEDAKPSGQSRDSPPDPELRWVEICERAARAFGTRRVYAAADYWRRAADFAHAFEPCDPRRAASLNNLGVAHRCHDDLDQARSFYHQAKAAWHSAIDAAGDLRPAPRARSSLFHMRMEVKHRHAFDRAYIEKYRLWLSAGLAATLNNAAEMMQAQGRMREAERGFLRALSTRSQARLAGDDGLAIITANLRGSRDAAAQNITTARQKVATVPSGFIEQAAANGWLIDNPPVFTDEGRVMAALLFTRLVAHGTLPSIRGDA